MKRFLIVCAISAGMGFGLTPQHSVAAPTVPAAVVAVTNIHPTEAKYDKIMEKYATGLKAAFAEKDDKKTIAMVNKLNDEMVSSFEKLKPELERWIKGMSEKDKEELEQRAGSKPYFKTIFEVMFDPEIGKRIENNAELKAALESSDKRMKALGFNNDDAEEEEEID